ncbi:hypothetical protein [Scopulibacillus darangshiensis]|uniref:hypothetical protein n=1 Tax=Scopulibacillus darangshiensis TaxID=442528 RepID=UPI00104F25AB|nr:hypothetical protein [Scopulibacillus darangshiensis]
MVGLILAVILFNGLAFKTNRRLTGNHIIHIWAFTVALQLLSDTFIDLKYHGYWYFTRGIDWRSIPALLVLIPPVNMMFINWYPFGRRLIERMRYIIYWVVFIMSYELITLLPEPWGYFHYGWWRIWYAIVVDPFLLLVVLNYYKFICKMEKAK